jgi:hypothetical protein
LGRFKNKTIKGSTPMSAAKKAITFVCSQMKNGCAAIVLKLKEIKIATKDGQKTMSDVSDKVYNYTGRWSSSKRSVTFKNDTINFKGEPIVKSCALADSKKSRSACKMLM